MRVYENAAPTRWAMNKLRERLGTGRTGKFHMSELFTCYRRVIKRRRDPYTFSDTSICNFMYGYAVQDYFFGPEDDSREAYGILFSPDYIEGNDVIEVKTTRKALEKWPKDESGKLDKSTGKMRFEPQEEWTQRTTAYCALMGVKRAHFVVFFLYQPGSPVSWTMELDDSDIHAALADIEQRRLTLEKWSASKSLPPCTCEDWMNDKCDTVFDVEVASE